MYAYAGLQLQPYWWQPGQTSQAIGAIPTVVVPPHPTYNAAPQAAPAGPVANVTLTVKEVLVSIAPGIAYHAWTFNGTVPGPILRVREGQIVHFTLINDGAMPHSIDFHAAQTPWNVNYQDVAPGKSLTRGLMLKVSNGIHSGCHCLER
jgi:nitrite reductase (NO-forming)